MNEKTVSMWSAINEESLRVKFLNPFYVSHGEQKEITKLKTTAYYELKIWHRFFFKYTDWSMMYRERQRISDPE